MQKQSEVPNVEICRVLDTTSTQTGSRLPLTQFHLLFTLLSLNDCAYYYLMARLSSRLLYRDVEVPETVSGHETGPTSPQTTAKKPWYMRGIRYLVKGHIVI